MTTEPLFTPTFRMIWMAWFLQELSFSLMVHFPGFLTDLGATESRIGVLYAVSALFALSLRPLVGRVMDQTSRRTVLLAVGAANAAAVATLTVFTSLGLPLFGVFVVHRILQIVLFTAILTYAADSLPEAQRAHGLGILGLAGLVPIAAGGAIGDVVITAVGFDGLFVAAAAAEIGSFVLVWQLPRVPSARAASLPRRSFFHAMRQRDLLPMWWIALMFAAGLETVFTYIRTFVDEQEVGTVGLFFGVYGTVAIAARLLGGRRMDQLPARSFLVWTTVAYGLGLAMLGQASSALLLAVAAFVAGLGHGLVFPVLSAQVVARSRTAERGSAMAIFTSIFDVALLTIAPAVGFIIDGRGYPPAFISVGVLLVAGAVLFGVVDRRVFVAELADGRPVAPEAV